MEYGINKSEQAANTRTKIIPAPLGLPSDFCPLTANARPWSLGKMFLHKLIIIHVAAKATRILINVISLMYFVPNNFGIRSLNLSQKKSMQIIAHQYRNMQKNMVQFLYDFFK